MKKKLILFFVKLTVLAALSLMLFLGSVHLGLFGHVYTESELREFKNELKYGDLYYQIRKEY